MDYPAKQYLDSEGQDLSLMVTPTGPVVTTFYMTGNEADGVTQHARVLFAQRVKDKDSVCVGTVSSDNNATPVQTNVILTLDALQDFIVELIKFLPKTKPAEEPAKTEETTP